MSINQIDLCAVIVDALENAVEAASKCQGGFVRFDAEQFQGFLKIELTNSCCVETVFVDGMPETTKVGIEGIGTKSICQIAEKHGGTAKFSQTGHIFTTRILLAVGAEN